MLTEIDTDKLNEISNELKRIEHMTEFDMSQFNLLIGVCFILKEIRSK